MDILELHPQKEKSTIKSSLTLDISEDIKKENKVSSSDNERTPKIILNIRKYYVMYTWNGNFMNFDPFETTAKNTLVYK